AIGTGSGSRPLSGVHDPCGQIDGRRARLTGDGKQLLRCPPPPRIPGRPARPPRRQARSTDELNLRRKIAARAPDWHPDPADVYTSPAVEDYRRRASLVYRDQAPDHTIIINLIIQP